MLKRNDMKKSLKHFLDHIFVVSGALLFSLFPSFIYQYQHQLVGHVNELELQIKTMRRNASKSGKNLNQYVQKFIHHADQDISSQGIAMERLLHRHARLTTSLSTLKNASFFSRPFVFLFYLQKDIFASTTANFQPALSLTSEGFMYIFLGCGFGYFLFNLLVGLWRKIIPRGKIIQAR